MTEEQKEIWERWLSERPAHVIKVAREYPPDFVYEYKREDGSTVNCLIVSYDELKNGSVELMISVKKDLNPDSMIAFDRRVIGIKPEQLTQLEKRDL